MIRREGKPKRIETFADLIQHVQKIDLENTEAFVLEDAKGNRYRLSPPKRIKKHHIR